jgi:hypothetical protein
LPPLNDRAAIFVHPLRPVGLDRWSGRRACNSWHSRSRGAGRRIVITGGVVDRHRCALRSVTALAGSLTLPRLAAGWDTLG